MNNYNISYAITTHNEDESLSKLLKVIEEYKDDSDEIIVVDDYSTNELTLDILSTYKNVYRRRFNKNYADQKNFLNSKCKNEYIFQFDADEFPSILLIKNIKNIIRKTKAELIAIPRSNIVSDVTPNIIKKWKWKVDRYKRLNYPDYQGRVYANKEHIKWTRPLHEYVIGFNSLHKIPQDTNMDIIHNKSLLRQLESNSRYYNNYNNDGSIREN